MQRSTLGSTSPKLNSAGKARQLQAQLEQEERARKEKERQRRATLVHQTLTRDTAEVSAMCFCEELMFEIAEMAGEKIVNDYFDRIAAQYTAHSLWDTMLSTIQHSLVTHDVPALPRDISLASGVSQLNTRSSATGTTLGSPLIQKGNQGSFKKVAAAVDATEPYTSLSSTNEHRTSLQHLSFKPNACPSSPYHPRKSSLNTTGEELLRGLDLGSLAKVEESTLLQSPKNSKLEVGASPVGGKSALKTASGAGTTLQLDSTSAGTGSSKRMSGAKDTSSLGGKVGFKIEENEVETAGTKHSPAVAHTDRPDETFSLKGKGGGGVSFGEAKKTELASVQPLGGPSTDSLNNGSVSNAAETISSPIRSAFRDPAVAMPDYDLHDPPSLVRGKWRVDRPPCRVPCDEQSRSAIPLNIRLATPPSSALSTTTASSMTARRARAHTTTLGRTLTSAGNHTLNSTLSAPGFSPQHSLQSNTSLAISQSTPAYAGSKQYGIFAKTISGSGTPTTSESPHIASPRDSIVTATRPPSSDAATIGPSVGTNGGRGRTGGGIIITTGDKKENITNPPSTSSSKKPPTPVTTPHRTVGDRSTPLHTTPRDVISNITSQNSSPKSATATTLLSTNGGAAQHTISSANGTLVSTTNQQGQRSRPPSSRPETAKQRAARLRKEEEEAVAETRRLEREEESALPADADVESHRQLRERLRREKLSKDAFALASQSVGKALANPQITSKPFVIDGSKGLVLNVMTVPESLAGKQSTRQANKEAAAAAALAHNVSDITTPRRARHGGEQVAEEADSIPSSTDPQYLNSSDGVVLKSATPRYFIKKDEKDDNKDKGSGHGSSDSPRKKLVFQPRRPSTGTESGTTQSGSVSSASGRRKGGAASEARQGEFVIPETMPHMLIDVVPAGGVAHTELTPRPLAMRQQMEMRNGNEPSTLASVVVGMNSSAAAPTNVGIRRQAEMVFPPSKMNRDEYMRLVAATSTVNQNNKREGEGFFDVPPPPQSASNQASRVPAPPSVNNPLTTGTQQKATPPLVATSNAVPKPSSSFNLDLSRISSIPPAGGAGSNPATPITNTMVANRNIGGGSLRGRTLHSTETGASSARKPSITSLSRNAAPTTAAAASTSIESAQTARSVPRTVQFNLGSSGVTVHDAGALFEDGDMQE